MAIFGKKNSQTNAQFDILPKNIGIIMDGNGRWAKKRALPRSAGHKAVAEVFRSRYVGQQFINEYNKALGRD